MSLSEIRSIEAQSNPINTFYTNSLTANDLTAALVTADDIDVKGGTITTPNIIANNITSEVGQDLKLQPGDGTHNVVVDAAKLTGSGVLNAGVCYLSTTGVVQSLTLGDGQLVIGRFGNIPEVGDLIPTQGIMTNPTAGSIGISRMPLMTASTLSATSIPSGVFTNLNLGVPSAAYDPYSFITSPTGFTIPALYGGVYWIQIGCRFADSLLGATRAIQLFRNGLAVNPIGYTQFDTAGRATVQTSFSLNFAVGDTFSVQALQDTGGALNVDSFQIMLECLLIQ